METKPDTINRIETLIGQLSARFAEEDADEKEWLQQQCSDRAQGALAQLSVSALHILDEVPTGDSSINIVGLSQATGVPKGTVSKTVQHLVTVGVVERHRLPDNRKEVHLRLTDLGAEIQSAHGSMHELMTGSLGEFLARYTTTELGIVVRILDDLRRTPRDGLRFRPDLIDSSPDTDSL